MDDRTRIGIQVWIIADKYNISQITVHTIINSYLSYCKELLVNGERVDFYGLVSIVPDTLSTNYSTTLAYNCSIIADRLGLPSYTVYRIMQAYIEDAIENIQNGVTVEMRGLVVCRPIYENRRVTKVHSNISQSLKNILASENTNVKSLRVHTYKVLRDTLSNV